MNWRPHVGPLFWYELTRSARRGREIWLRCVYGSFLLIALFLVYTNWLAAYYRGYNPWDIFEGASLPLREMSSFANSFFSALMISQLVAVLLLTPAYTAGAIAGEKERRTLEFLLTTDLSDSEIVLGKLLARLATLGLLLLTGLPVVSLMELWGGIDPVPVLAGFMVTAMTMFAVGSLSVLVSIHAKGYLQAVFHSYVYLTVFTVCCGLPVLSVAAEMFSRLTRSFQPAYALINMSVCALLLAATGVGLSLAAVSQFREAALPRGRVLRAAPRPPARKPAPAPPPERPAERPPMERPAPPARSAPQYDRVPIGDSAMLWKELTYEQNINELFPTGLWKEMRAPTGGILFVCLLLACCCTGLLSRDGSLLAYHVGEGLMEVGNLFIRSLGAPLCCVAFFVVALRAGGSISREREQQTLEGLLMTPLDREEILFAKLLGCILCIHPFWWTVAIALGVGLLTGSLHVLAVPLLATAVVVYAVLAAGVGLWFSSLPGTTLQSTLRTVLAVLVLGGGAWMWSEYAKNFMASFLSPAEVQWVQRLLIYGLTPPVTLHALAFHYGDFLASPGSSSWENLLAAVVGVLCYALLGWLVWRSALSRLRPAKERVTKRRLRRAEADLQTRR
jgi:ABC-type transport system involved in multi-copper enzyme maturation permease subunit